MPRGIPKASVSVEARERRKDRRRQVLRERQEQRQRILLSAGSYQVFRLDADNYVLTDAPDNANKYEYYPHLEDAAEELLTKRFEQLARPGIEGLMQALRQAKAEVLASLQKLGCEATEGKRVREGRLSLKGGG